MFSLYKNAIGYMRAEMAILGDDYAGLQAARFFIHMVNHWSAVKVPEPQLIGVHFSSFFFFGHCEHRKQL